MARIKKAPLSLALVRRLSYCVSSENTVSVGHIKCEMQNHPKTLSEFLNDFAGEYYIDWNDLQSWLYMNEVRDSL
jgi:hypothetical protein